MMAGIDTPAEVLELGLSVLIALLAVASMQALEACRLAGPRMLWAGRAALALLAAGAGLSGARPVFEVASPQILILAPLGLVLAWVWVASHRGAR